jgi:transmembrane sensor
MDLERYSNKHLKAILKKYVDGKATREEKKAIDTWYELFESDNDNLNDEFDEQRFYKLLHDGIDGQRLHQLKSQNNVRQLWYRISAAAAVLLFLAIGIVYIKGSKTGKQEDQVVSTVNSAHKTITLPDGSVVELNGHSRLTISNNFNQNDRKVTLQGEAFFEIAKNPSKPFIIKSGVLQTVVKGTSFDIRAYHDLDHIKVSVATGIVKIIRQVPNTSPEILTDGIIKNQTLTYDLKTGKGEIRSESTPEISSWRNNELVIDNFTLPEIASLLNRHFAKKVNVKPGVAVGRHYTMKMTNPSLNHALHVLSALTKHTFTLRNNQIIINN